MKKNLLIIVGIVLFLIAFVFIAYLIDTNRISTFADEESQVGIDDLTEIPSPDESIISKIFTGVRNIFTND